jgi:2-polyprenyl-6-methoxyphenol hydroxylase-like FAD-dependent oxidoreductase
VLPRLRSATDEMVIAGRRPARWSELTGSASEGSQVRGCADAPVSGFDVPWPPPGTPSSVIEWLRQRFGRWGPPVPDLPDVVSEVEIEAFPHAWHKVPRRIVSDHAARTGDAVHIPPVLAQGANQSLEDAWFLVRELDATRPLNDVLLRYQKQRRRKVAFVSRAARLPMLSICGRVAVGRPRGPLISDWFCAAAWRANMCACCSTLPL